METIMHLKLQKIYGGVGKTNLKKRKMTARLANLGNNVRNPPQAIDSHTY